MLPTAFDTWLDETFACEGPFTMFLILFEDVPSTIVPIASSYLHVIGPDVTWVQIAALISEGTATWHSMAVFAAKHDGGGPLPDVLAQQRLVTLQQAVLGDRLTVKRGELFDTHGRRLELELRGD